MAYPRISKNSAGYARGIIIPLTRQRINCKFLDLEEIGEIFIYNVAHCITAGEFTNTNGSKRLMSCLMSILTAGEIKTSNLHETFPDLFL